MPFHLELLRGVCGPEDRRSTVVSRFAIMEEVNKRACFMSAVHKPVFRL